MNNEDANANEAYSNKVISSGTWIDASFLRDVLSDTLHTRVDILDYNVKAAVAAGDNYLSTLYRTFVTFTTDDSQEPQQKHLIIKGMALEKFLQDLAEDMHAFDKEIRIYRRVLPAMQRYLKDHFMGDSENVTPEGYVCLRPNTLVMEDISVRGYKMANRLDQLDLEHSLVTLRTLARFHALSVKLYKDDPELILSVAEDIYQEANRAVTGQMVAGLFPAMLNIMEKWPEGSRFVPQVREVSRHIWDKLMYITKQSDTLNVLNHGDLWVNNIMYKYDEDGNIVSAKIIDFQITRYTSPANDLLYFFFTSTKAHVLAGHMDELTLAYHDALSGDMDMLGLDEEYSFSQLQEDMRRRSLFALLAVAQILPLVLSPPSAVINTDETSVLGGESNPDEHPMAKNYRNPVYRAAVCKHLSLLDGIGYLDAAVESLQPLTSRLDRESRQLLLQLNEEATTSTTARTSPTKELNLMDRLMRILSQPICD